MKRTAFVSGALFSVDVKGSTVDVKGYTVDVKGSIVDVKGLTDRFRLWRFSGGGEQTKKVADDENGPLSP
eukprot:2335972-Pyramimonas_sp.AAC.1